MYNLRYHIASLVSVFLALALGLVLGGLIVQRGTLDRGQEGLIEGLQQEFSTLRTENRALTAENQQLTAFATDFVDAWSAERLAGRSLIVFTNAGREPGYAASRAAIEGAGGTVVTVRMVAPRFGLDDEDLRSQIETLVAETPDPEASIAASLAAEWSQAAEERPMTTALVDLGVLSIEGLAAEVAVDGMIVIAAPEGQSDAGAIAVGREFRRLLLPAVGAQTPDTDSGVAANSAAAGLAAFDTLGTQIGRYTAVALLAGAEPALYGTATAAEALYPPLPQMQGSGPSL